VNGAFGVWMSDVCLTGSPKVRVKVVAQKSENYEKILLPDFVSVLH